MPSSDSGSERGSRSPARREASPRKSSSPRKSPSPTGSPPAKKGRSPIRAPSKSPTPEARVRRDSKSKSPERRRRSPSPRRRRDSRSPRRDERRRSRSRDRERRDRRRSRSRDRDDRRRRSDSRSPKRSRRDSPARKEKSPAAKKVEEPKKEPMDLLRTRAGGAYIPPAKLKMMQQAIQDKNSEQYQRMNWERLKKKIHGLVNKVNTGNLVGVVRELLQENVIRGKGLLSRSIIQAQAFSPLFSHVYAALVSVINSKFPHIGELILRRLIVQFKRSFRRSDKNTTVTVSKFIAHLINQQVAHELLALEIMLLMLETPTDDSVEVAIAFLKECGSKLQEVAPRALASVFDRLRSILQDAELDKRVRYMIEVAFHIRKDKFAAHPAVIDDLDLIDEDDQITHTITLEDAIDPENALNVFKLDAEFEKNEAMYDEIRAEIIGDADDSDDDEEGAGGDDEDEDDEEGGEGAAAPSKPTTEIIDNTEQGLVAFRREVYLTIQSSLDYQEAAHKLLRMKVKKEYETELCHMLVDCNSQARTYERFYGLLCERFCRLKLEFQQTFEQVARDTYNTIHRFEITKLRNMARLISHLLFSDAISWNVLSEIKLTEEDTTSSGRIYIKYIFQELAESMGLAKLYERVVDPTMQSAFAGIFPRDNPQNSRFAINFFTLIGLGGLTVDLREWLAKGAQQKKNVLDVDSDSSSSSSSSSSDSDSDSDSSDSSSSSDSSDSSDDDRKKRKKKKAAAKKKAEKKERKKKDKKSKKRAEAEVKREEESDREASPVRKGRGDRERDEEKEKDRRVPVKRRSEEREEERGGRDRRDRDRDDRRDRDKDDKENRRRNRSPSRERRRRSRSSERKEKEREREIKKEPESPERRRRSPSPSKDRRRRSPSPDHRREKRRSPSPDRRRRRSVSNDRRERRRRSRS